VNAALGRQAGDQVLREVVTRARDTLRHTDVLCRYGGAIFAVALRGTGAEAAAIVADKLRAMLAGSPYIGGQVALSFSAGVATLPPGDPAIHDPVDFAGRAEAALAVAKREGGGRTCVWRDGATETPAPLDRLRCAFTGDQDRDYRNMGLLWDTVGLLASGGPPGDFAGRVVSQLRRTLSTSLTALFEMGPRGPVLRYGLGPAKGPEPGDEPIATGSLTREQQQAVAEAADGRLAVWRTADRGEGDDHGPGPVTCAVPLLVGDNLAGVLLLAGTSGEVKFDESDLPFLRGLGGPLGLALERAGAAEREREQEELEKRRLVGELRDLRTALRRARIVHVSAQMEDLILTAHRVADTDATVLITGESGTGKELLAQTVHQMSRRRDRPFVIVDCGAIPATLIESELFGHEKGAFTGALQRSAGRLMQADRGTVLLDEIGELPLEVQSKLLRFVQDRQFTTVGSSVVREVDVRVLAATNRDLSHEVTIGRFRADLYHRLNVISLVIPPLRERPEDILEIAKHFLDVFAAKYHKPVGSLGAEVEDALLAYAWPGNVRELQNRIMRAVIMSTGRTLTVDALSLPRPAPGPMLTIVGGRGTVGATVPEEPSPAGVVAPPLARVAWPAGQPEVRSCSAEDAWAALRAALEGALVGVTTASSNVYPPLGRWLADDLALAAFEVSGRVASRAAVVLGLPETTYVRRLRRAQNEAHLVRRPPEWAPVARAVQSLVRAPVAGGQNVLEAAEACLLECIRRHPRADGHAGAFLLGTSLPTFRRRIASLAV
jgi:diguanylate cyclase (GGDEF)-like protein